MCNTITIRSIPVYRMAFVAVASTITLSAVMSGAQQVEPASGAGAVYRQANAPIDRRVDDLVGRMTLEEKVRQLDLYAGAKALVDKRKDATHATADAVFLPEKAQALFGDLGVGGIHDLYPTPEQSNAIQRWVIAHSRLGIPVLFIEEGLHGFDTGTVFPTPINLAATWNPAIAQQTSAAIASEIRATGFDMVLAPVLDVARDPTPVFHAWYSSNTQGRCLHGHPLRCGYAIL